MKVKTYNNGLRLVVNSKKDVNVVSFKIFVTAGAKDEKEQEFGFAHFLEHMFFKSTKNTNHTDLLKKLDDLGVIKNAYTGVSNTCYFFKSLGDKVEEAIELFSEMFFNKTFKTEEVEKEKLVILEEYKMDLDDPMRKCIRQAYKSMFAKTELGHDVIGTAESIKSVTSKKLLNFKKRYYKPSNVVISISGNIKFNKAKKLVERFFVNNFKEKDNKKDNSLKYLSLKPSKKYVLSSKDNEQSMVYILTDLKDQSFHNKIAYQLLFAILGMDMSSKFFEIIRGQKGLVYSIDADTTKVGKNYLSEIFFATSNDRVKDALVSIKEILKECADGKITQDELSKIKTKYISGFVFESESNGNIASNNGLDIIDYNRVISVEELTKEYMSVTLEEIIELSKNLVNEKNYVVSAVGKCKLEDLKVF